MACCATVRAVAHGAGNACGVVVVSAGSPQCPLPAPPRRRSASPSSLARRRDAPWKSNTRQALRPGYVNLLKKSRPHRRQSLYGKCTGTLKTSPDMSSRAGKGAPSTEVCACVCGNLWGGGWRCARARTMELSAQQDQLHARSLCSCVARGGAARVSCLTSPPPTATRPPLRGGLRWGPRVVWSGTLVGA